MSRAQRHPRVFENVGNYELEGPQPLFRELPPAPDFPVGSLGEILGLAAIAIQNHVQCAVALSAQSLLGAASVAVQNHINVVLPTGAAKPPSLYLLTVGGSGERKSSSDTWAMKPIRDYEKHLRKQYKADFAKWKNEDDLWAKDRKRILAEDGLDGLEALGIPPLSPLEPLLTCEEPTYAGLCRTYERGYPGIGIFSDEGGEFIGGHAMKEENRLRTITGLSKLWDGGELKRVRAGDGISSLTGKRLSLHLLIQPMMALDFLSDPAMNNQGFLSRFLFTYPESTMGTRLFRRPSSNDKLALDRYDQQLTRILQLPIPVSQDTDRSLTPRPVHLSSWAEELWIQFHDSVESQLSQHGDLRPIAGFANKLAENAIRLAAVVAFVDDPNLQEISGEQMANGIKLAQYYLREAQRLLMTGHVDSSLQDAKHLLDWLRSGRWEGELISPSDLIQCGPNRFRTRKKLDPLVDILVSYGWLRLNAPAEIKGKRRQETYQIVRGQG